MADLNSVLNRLAKWRMIFAGWQLGTRTKDDPEAQAVRDHREVTILLRAEANAVTQLLIRKQVFTEEEFRTQLIEEAELLNKAYEKFFPGCTATDQGIQMNVRAAEWMKNWRP